jgi:hypothetical protein
MADEKSVERRGPDAKGQAWSTGRQMTKPGEQLRSSPRGCGTVFWCRLQTRSFSRRAIGITRTLIALNSLIEKSHLDGSGCHPFSDLVRSGRSPSIIARR